MRKKMDSIEFDKIHQEYMDGLKSQAKAMPLIDSLHDDLGNPTFEIPRMEMDCRYPVLDPLEMLKEMREILQEVRDFKNMLDFAGYTDMANYARLPAIITKQEDIEIDI